MRDLVASPPAKRKRFLAYYCTCVFVAREVIMNNALFQQSPSGVLEQPWRGQRQESQIHAYLTLKNNTFARWHERFSFLYISQPLSSDQRGEMTGGGTARAPDNKLFSWYLQTARINLIPQEHIFCKRRGMVEKTNLRRPYFNSLERKG